MIEDCQCLGPLLLGFWVAQIGDGFGGDRCGSWRGRAWWRWGWIPMGFVMFLGFCCDSGFLLASPVLLGFYCDTSFFFFFFFFFNMSFCSDGILVGSGHGGGTVVVTR